MLHADAVVPEVAEVVGKRHADVFTLPAFFNFKILPQATTPQFNNTVLLPTYVK